MTNSKTPRTDKEAICFETFKQTNPSPMAMIVPAAKFSEMETELNEANEKLKCSLSPQELEAMKLEQEYLRQQLLLANERADVKQSAYSKCADDYNSEHELRISITANRDELHTQLLSTQLRERELEKEIARLKG